MGRHGYHQRHQPAASQVPGPDSIWTYILAEQAFPASTAPSHHGLQSVSCISWRAVISTEGRCSSWSGGVTDGAAAADCCTSGTYGR